MEKNKSYIAYTIIVERADGKPMFLVEHEDADFLFPATETIDEKSGLSTIIAEIKRTLSINFDKLELSELTNAVINDHRIPLFVFNYDCSECEPEDILIKDTNYEWQISDNFTDTLQQYEIKGVPLF